MNKLFVKMMVMLLAAAVFFQSGVALSADMGSQIDLLKSFDFGTLLSQIIQQYWPQSLGVLMSLSVGLRGLSEVLVWVSDKTQNTWDNKLSYYVSEASWALGVLVSKPGFGTPKAIVVEQAKSAPVVAAVAQSAAIEAAK